MKRRTKNLVGIEVIRALAIIAIIIYHMNIRLLPGGFMGVDLFFVLSGYLTMTSLGNSYKRDGGINFTQFIYKKIKKLVPALFTMIFVVLIFLVLFNKPLLETSNTDAISGMTFTSNIWFIIKKLDYFDSFSVSPFKHLWYLGVQAQMYIVLAILVKFLGVSSGKKKVDNLLITLSALAALSLLAHILMFRIDNINRIYYGTDTRAFEFLLGAIGARLIPYEKLTQRKSPKERMILNGIGFLSLAIFIYMAFNISEYSLWLYQGGFFLIALLALAMIASIGGLGSIIGRLLGKKPLLFIGKISYGLYLWHFPIVVLSKTANEAGSPNLLFSILRVIVFSVLAILSYNFVEQPIESKGFREFFIGIGNSIKNLGSKTKLTVRVAAMVMASLFVMGLFGIAFPYTSSAFIYTSKDIEIAESYTTSGSRQPKGEKPEAEQPVEQPKDKEPETEEPQSEQPKDKEPETEQPQAEQPAEQPKDKEPETEQPQAEQPKDKETETEQPQAQQPGRKIKYNTLVVIGDSLAVNVGPAIKEQFDNTYVDAKVSRQLYKSAGVAEQYAGYDSENTAIIFLLGTNGYFTEGHIDNLIKSFKKSDIYFVNTKMPNDWETQVNETLASYTSKNPQTTLIDWHSLAKSHPEYLAKDKTHLMSSGIDAMINIIFNALSNK